MASRPATPPAGEPREPAGARERDARTASEPPAPPSGEERYGPLNVLRTRKADGRSLILYSRERPASDADAADASDADARDASERGRER